ncbi:MAG TPA: hypothetical protein VHY80_18590 [Stellaceae bacterium]|nr:hypothetical protein [Stellaceae bacterium]
MTFDKQRSLRKAALATALAGAVLGAAALPAAARGFVSFGVGAPVAPVYGYGPTYYQPYDGYGYGYAYAPPPPAYYYPPPAPVYGGPVVNFGFRVR